MIDHMIPARRYRHSYADYVRLERESPLKLEFSGGEIYAMAGGTPEHGALAMQLVRLLSISLPAGCRVLSSDVKVRIEAADLSTYPDLSIVCGPIERSSEDLNAIVNPRVLVEVTSPSSEDYDRGGKLEQYKLLESVEAVVVVSHRAREVTVVRRRAGKWETQVLGSAERVSLEGDLAFDVAALYSVLEGIS